MLNLQNNNREEPTLTLDPRGQRYLTVEYDPYVNICAISTDFSSRSQTQM